MSVWKTIYSPQQWIPFNLPLHNFKLGFTLLKPE